MIKDKKSYNILVIEDNPGDFALVDDFLREGILTPHIEHAISYKQASEILLAGDKIFDVILLDLGLPDKKGQCLVSEMLKIAPSFPIIVLTGYTDMEFSIKSISLGIFDYLLKDELSAATLYKSIMYAIERYKNITALQKSEKRSRDLFNLSPQPMWVYDRQTYAFVQVNDAAIAHYGYSRDEFFSMTIMDIRPEHEITYTKGIIDALKGTENEIHQGKYMHQKKSGDIFEVELFSSPISLNDIKLRSVIAVDITERNLVEQKIMKAIIKTQEDERYEIGGELHDNVCQILAASQFKLDMLKDSIPSSRIPIFDQCRSHLKLVLDEIRNLSHRLAPAFFDNSSLEEAFDKLFATFNFGEKFDIRTFFGKEINTHTLSLEIQLNLYRILQEQLRNIQKYSNANRIEVDLLIYNSNLRMRISDNGVGFDVDTVKGGIGVANMKRRAELFSGKFEIVSSPNKGCTVYIEIPLEKDSTLRKIA